MIDVAEGCNVASSNVTRRRHDNKQRQGICGYDTRQYHRANRNEKRDIVDEFTRVTGYHRKVAIRLLSEESGSKRLHPNL